MPHPEKKKLLARTIYNFVVIVIAATRISEQKVWVSGEYPPVVNGTNHRVLEIPGPSVTGDSDGNRASRVLAVKYPLAELP